jgi:hypothetical protein
MTCVHVHLARPGCGAEAQLQSSKASFNNRLTAAAGFGVRGDKVVLCQTAGEQSRCRYRPIVLPLKAVPELSSGGLAGDLINGLRFPITKPVAAFHTFAISRSIIRAACLSFRLRLLSSSFVSAVLTF